MSVYKGKPRINQREPRYTDWRRPTKYSTELASKYYPTLEGYPYKNKSFQKNKDKTSLPSSSVQDVKQPKAIIDVFSRFADTTSLHTMPFINRAARWYAKLIWVIIFIVATGAWIFHSYYLIRTYLIYETSSSVKIVYETVDFPSVTLCNINPVRVTGVTEYGTQELLVFLTQITPPTVYDNDYKREDKEPDGGLGSNNDTNGSDVETTLSPSKDRKKRNLEYDNEVYEYYYYNDIADFELGDCVNWTHYMDIVHDNKGLLFDENVRENVKINTVFKELLAANSDSNRTKMAHELKTMMISCSYDGKECSVRNFSRWLDINYGVCWTFNSVELSSGAVTSVRGGSSFGLDLILYIQKDEYLKGLSLGQGVRLDIHPFGSLPFVQDNGMSIAPGLQHYLALRMLNQTRLGGRYGDCGDDGSFVKYYENRFNYTTEGCINTCLDRTIAAKCNCYRRTQRQYYRQSDIQKGYCDTDTELECSNGYIARYSRGDLTCGCNQACQTIEYETASSFDLWPDDALWYSLVDAVCVRDEEECLYLMDTTDTDEREDVLRQNFLHLNVFYRDLNVEKVEEQAAYETVQFVSDLGGAVGLWIGASLITLFEVLDLSCQLCNFCRRSQTYKARKQQLQFPSYTPRDFQPSRDFPQDGRSRSLGENVHRADSNKRMDWHRHSKVDDQGNIV